MNNNESNKINSQNQQEITETRQMLINSRLREPVSGIFALLPLIADNINKSNGDKALVHLETVSRQSYALLRSVTNITLAAKIMSGKQTTSELINFSALLESVIFGVKTVINNITIDAEIENNIMISGNRDLISNAVLNLISNSLYFASDKPVKIFIKLKSDKKNAVFNYRDNSKGIKDTNIEKVFSPYFSHDPYDDNEPSPSLGLGLYIARAAFEQAGGTMLLSSSFGDGVKYTVSIPSDDPNSDILESRPSDFLLNRYSNLFVQLCNHCNLPPLS